MKEKYKICNYCVMDTSDEDIVFNENGRCNHCIQAEKLLENNKVKMGKLKELISKIKEEEKNKKYDCIMGISGGVDSAYVAFLAKNLGLRVLAIHVDAGWNTEVAEENISKICNKLDIDLEKIVVDWETMKELQRAYMFSGLPNLDVPQDHAFISGVYHYARKYGIKYMLNGNNFATESILPSSWGYTAKDYTNIKDIYRKHGRGKSLKKYPHFGVLKFMFYQLTVKRIDILNYIEYSKEKAIDTLTKEFDWKYYGGKHYESIFTKFFQAYYLPKRYGYDKKRAHLSSLIVNREITREEGLKELEDRSYREEEQLKDRDYILSKLDISLEEWNKIMNLPKTSEDEYKTNKFWLNFFAKLKKIYLSIFK